MPGRGEVRLLTDIFWINLDSRPDRRRFMETQFAGLGLAAERIAAVTPETLDAQARARGPRLAASELCVTTSHAVAWGRLLERGLTHALVLEDDACLSRTLPSFLAEADALMTELDLVRIETGRRRVRLGPVSHTLRCGVTLRGAHSGQWGTAGYVISGRAAERMLIEPRLFDMALDDVFFDPGGPAFASLAWRQCAPGLCIQGDLLTAQAPDDLWRSDVTTERRRRRAADPQRKQRLSWAQRLAREAGRLGRQGGLMIEDARDFLARGIRWTTIRFLAE